MNPQQQYQGQPGSPYEFILNPSGPQKPKRFGLGKNHFVLTIVAIVGGVIIFMIVVSVLINAFTPKKVSKEDLIGVAQTQTELSRISNLAENSATGQSTKNLAITVDYSMQSQRQQTTQLLSKSGIKIGKKQYAFKQDATTDQKFAAAKATSTYDLVYSQIVQTELENYAKDLKSLYNRAVSKTEQDMVGNFYQQTQQIISQIPYTQNSINAGE